jgi:metal transporter CNNM
MAAAPHGGLGEGILPDGGQGAKDGVRALQAGYGTISRVGTENNETQDSNDQSIRPEPTREDSQVTVSTAGPLIERAPISPARSAPARSGSITENIIEAGGFKKVVLETASSSEENTSRLTAVVAESTDGAAEDGIVGDGEESAKSGKKKRRRKRKKPGSRAEAVAEAGVEAGADAEAEPEEDTPLMDGHA